MYRHCYGLSFSGMEVFSMVSLGRLGLGFNSLRFSYHSTPLSILVCCLSRLPVRDSVCPSIPCKIGETEPVETACLASGLWTVHCRQPGNGKKKIVENKRDSLRSFGVLRYRRFRDAPE